MLFFSIEELSLYFPFGSWDSQDGCNQERIVLRTSWAEFPNHSNCLTAHRSTLIRSSGKLDKEAASLQLDAVRKPKPCLGWPT